ncbi:MAG: hypothetical protein E7401_05345 [Ruminococcaceae bacterium]|nr:hypothetical protein [Oscillospiraceae bacterium]
MLKTVTKILLMFFGLTALAAVSATISYIITKNSIANKAMPVSPPSSVSTGVLGSDAGADARPLSETAKFDWYIVRLEGDMLGVYAQHGNAEEFLYGETVYANNLSREDRELLNHGVVLETSEALTGFIENFTS